MNQAAGYDTPMWRCSFIDKTDFRLVRPKWIAIAHLRIGISEREIGVPVRTAKQLRQSEHQ